MTLRWILCAAVALGCGEPGRTDPPPENTDFDGDGIADVDEGRASNVDADGDGTPDWQDVDADGNGRADSADGTGDADGDGAPDFADLDDDGDGLDDRQELGPDVSNPVDSDGDGSPDYRDTDADGNGRADGTDGTGDADGDGTADFADLDDDGDGLDDGEELGSDASMPLDSDGDGSPDYRDTDADGDTISDRDERMLDYDGDGIGNWRDTDSDNDCRSDRTESGGAGAPRDSDADGRSDFTDRDSDNDGIADGMEDTNCDGLRNGNESDPTLADTDGDGASDLVESTVGTDPNDPSSNPAANGDIVFVMPHQGQPSPMDDTLGFTSRVRQLDLYVLLDRSGSMSAEFASVRNNLGTVLQNLRCPPLGNGDPATCIPDLWAGAGTIGYSGSTGGQAYLHSVDIQSNPNVSGLPSTEPNGCCAEPLTFGVFAAITGNGTASASSCGIQPVPARATCAGSPAANAGFTPFGYPCFREGALPIVLLATDEVPLSAGDTNKCPNWSSVVRPSMIARSAKLVGIVGDGAPGAVVTDLRTMAVDTGAVDSTNGAEPLVFDGSGANAASAIENGIRTLANNIPLDMRAAPLDDPSDAVDAVAAFLDRLETSQLGTPACANMLEDRDTNGDTFDDEYVDVRVGTPVCWKLTAKPNDVVGATEMPQLFRAIVDVIGDGVTVLDSRDVLFIVPPVALD